MAGVVYGLDYGAVMTVGAALGVDTALLAEMLPRVEPIVVACHAQDAEADA